MTSRQQGVSLVEAIIGLSIGIVVLSILWMVFRMNAVQRHRADVKMQGVTSAMPCVDMLNRDAALLYLDEGHGLSVHPNGRPGLSFYVYDDARSELARGLVRTKRVSYFLDRQKLSLYRQVDGEPAHRFHGVFEDFLVQATPADSYWDQPPWSSARTGLSGPGGMVSYVIVSLPAEYAVTERRLWKPQDRTAVWGAFPLATLNGRLRFAFWNPTVTATAETGHE